jgi:hypothetical protein
MEVEALYRGRYVDFAAKHFHKHLMRDNAIAWGSTWTKQFL